MFVSIEGGELPLRAGRVSKVIVTVAPSETELCLAGDAGDSRLTVQLSHEEIRRLAELSGIVTYVPKRDHKPVGIVK